MTNTAVVTIDIQMDYFLGGRFPLWRARHALGRAASVLAAARTRALPIFHVQHEGLDPKGRFLVAGTKGIELHPGLGIPADGSEKIIIKHYPDSFLETELESTLRENNITTVIWMGMMSWMCVDTTVRAAKALGFQNYLVEDACAAGWLLYHGLPVFPGSSHRIFMAALGAHHAAVLNSRKAARMIQ